MTLPVFFTALFLVLNGNLGHISCLEFFFLNGKWLLPFKNENHTNVQCRIAILRGTYYNVLTDENFGEALKDVLSNWHRFSIHRRQLWALTYPYFWMKLQLTWYFTTKQIKIVGWFKALTLRGMLRCGSTWYRALLPLSPFALSLSSPSLLCYLYLLFFITIMEQSCLPFLCL